MIIVRGP